MADLASQISEARKQGYSEDDIVGYLGSSHPELAPKIKEAKSAGYGAGDIIGHLSGDSERGKINHEGYKSSLPYPLNRLEEATSDTVNAMSEGAAKLFGGKSTVDDRLGGVSQMARGFMNSAGVPLALEAGVAAPLKAAKAIAVGLPSQALVKAITSGAGPGTSDFLADAAGLTAGAKAATTRLPFETPFSGRPLQILQDPGVQAAGRDLAVTAAKELPLVRSVLKGRKLLDAIRNVPPPEVPPPPANPNQFSGYAPPPPPRVNLSAGQPVPVGLGMPRPPLPPPPYTEPTFTGAGPAIPVAGGSVPTGLGLPLPPPPPPVLGDVSVTSPTLRGAAFTPGPIPQGLGMPIPPPPPVEVAPPVPQGAPPITAAEMTKALGGNPRKPADLARGQAALDAINRPVNTPPLELVPPRVSAPYPNPSPANQLAPVMESVPTPIRRAMGDAAYRAEKETQDARRGTYEAAGRANKVDSLIAKMNADGFTLDALSDVLKNIPAEKQKLAIGEFAHKYGEREFKADSVNELLKRLQPTQTNPLQGAPIEDQLAAMATQAQTGINPLTGRPLKGTK